VKEAIEEFDRERAMAEPHRLYGREYTMNADLGQGAALLRVQRPDEAARSFESALALYPGHPLAHAGLAVATGAAFDPAGVDNPITRGIALAALGRYDPAAATLMETLADAPPGFHGWWLPVEPFLAQPADNKTFAGIMQRLSERAR
jgi:tetratricopeptide (TPR) repeat protein